MQQVESPGGARRMKARRSPPRRSAHTRLGLSRLLVPVIPLSLPPLDDGRMGGWRRTVMHHAGLVVFLLDLDREGRRGRIDEREGIGDLRGKGEGPSYGRDTGDHADVGIECHTRRQGAGKSPGEWRGASGGHQCSAVRLRHDSIGAQGGRRRRDIRRCASDDVER